MATPSPHARRPLAAAAASLAVAGAALACLLPPLNERLFDYVALTVAVSLALAVAIVLHLVFVGIAARRMGRSPLWWVLGALLLFPVASIVGLILVDWYADEKAAAGETA